MRKRLHACPLTAVCDFARTRTPFRSVPGATVLNTVPYFFTLSCSSSRAPVGLVRVHHDLVVDAFHPRRDVLPDAMHADLNAAQRELQHRRHAFDALDHAGGKRGEQKFSRVQCIAATGERGVERQRGVLARRQTA